MQRNPANVAAHDFNNQNTVVGFGRGVQPVNGVGGNGHGGIKTEGVVGGVDVIVNGLGNTNDGHAVISEPLRAFECALAANSDECVDSGIFQIGFDGFYTVFEFIRVHAYGVNYCAAELVDAVLRVVFM